MRRIGTIHADLVRKRAEVLAQQCDTVVLYAVHGPEAGERIDRRHIRLTSSRGSVPIATALLFLSSG